MANDLLELRPNPAFLATEDGRVFVANVAAQQWIDETPDWSVGANGHVGCRNARLLAMLGELAGSQDARANSLARMMIWADGRQTLSVVFKLGQAASAHVPSYALDHDHPSQPLFLVTFFDGRLRQSDDDLKMLADAFELTPTEGRVALAMLGRNSLQDIAVEFQLKISTVRWHLRNILEKTGYANQSDLIRMLASLFS